MHEINRLKTVLEFSEIKFKEKNSQFIAQVFPCEEKDHFEKKYQIVKKKFYTATHHCYAYKFQDKEFKYSDDGEPNGTAGIRIYNAINHFDLTNIGLIVIRYFGGTKLGVGPLGKAYYYSAEQAIKSAKIIERKRWLNLSIKFDFNFTSLVHRTISKYNGKITGENYVPGPEIYCMIPAGDKKDLSTFLIDSSNGQITITEYNQPVWM